MTFDEHYLMAMRVPYTGETCLGQHKLRGSVLSIVLKSRIDNLCLRQGLVVADDSADVRFLDPRQRQQAVIDAYRHLTHNVQPVPVL